MTNATAERFTAWVTNDTSAVPNGNVDVTVLADEISGYRDGEEGEQIPQWTSTGNQQFYAETGVDAREGDIADALREAEQLLREAGWRRVEDWDVTDTSYVAVVERV